MARPRMRIRIISWDEVVNWCISLADLIKASSYKPDVIIASARGGFVPARLISDLLDVGELLALQVTHWGEATVRGSGAILRNPYRVDLSGKKALIVDDIIDTGLTMLTLLNYVKNEWRPREVRTAVISWVSSIAKIKPDYYLEELREREWDWYLYPWKRVDDIASLIARILREDDRVRGVDWITFDQLKDLFLEWYGVAPEAFGYYWGLALERLEARGIIARGDGRLRIVNPGAPATSL